MTNLAFYIFLLELVQGICELLTQSVLNLKEEYVERLPTLAPESQGRESRGVPGRAAFVHALARRKAAWRSIYSGKQVSR